MLLNLRQIRTDHERFERTYRPEAFAGDRDSFRVGAPVTLAFDLDKDQAQFRLVGRMQTTVELSCSRCLEPFPWPIDTAFDLRYQPRVVNTGEGEREVEEDDLSVAFYSEQTIDLGQLMREQVYLALPMKPLCSEGCRGLCRVCGANLNQVTCDCTQGWDDPRLAALKALKTRPED